MMLQFREIGKRLFVLVPAPGHSSRKPREERACVYQCCPNTGLCINASAAASKCTISRSGIQQQLPFSPFTFCFPSLSSQRAIVSPPRYPNELRQPTRPTQLPIRAAPWFLIAHFWSPRTSLVSQLVLPGCKAPQSQSTAAAVGCW